MDPALLSVAEVLDRVYGPLDIPDESIAVWFERSLPDRRRIMRARLADLRDFIDRIQAMLDEREARHEER
jgi:hypothetical protein